ncbi:MAG TPA: hypothetical protein VGG81_07695 [Edaphobacter sp.]|jgi:hypothetical protein
MKWYDSDKWRLVIAICLIAAPALAFYVILYKTAVNLPLLDDYQSILDVGNSIAKTHDPLSRLEVVVTSQHNGYKQLTNNVLVWACYRFTGHVRMLLLIAIGDAFALLIFLPVALMARSLTTDRATWLLLLVPVACFIFQLQYASALNFASCSIQEIGVIAFSLLSIYFLSKDAGNISVISYAFTVLAALSSPNGFFLAPVGAFMLAGRRQWKQLGIWTAVFCVLLGLYMFRYSGVPITAVDKTPAHSINLIYALAFVGASAARYVSILPALVLGFLICGIVVLAAIKRYDQRNPAVFYSMVFILINAVAVSGLRSGQGVAQSLASRYRIYSNLMLAFSYLFLLQQWILRWKGIAARRLAITAAIMLSAAFCLLSDLAGARFLEAKKIALQQSYRMQWLGLPAETADETEIDRTPVLARQLHDGVFNPNLPTLRESVRLGVYQPPMHP